MDKDLDGKTAVVTGGSRGLGAALVKELCGRGARVAVIARDAERLRRSLAEHGDAALAMPADLCDPAQVRGAFERIGEALGPLGFLVNNAGAGNWYPIERLPDGEIAMQLGTNFTAAVYCTRAAIPLMRRGGGGVILNVSSESAQQPVHGLALYGASKAALEAFSLAANLELRADRIKAMVVRLGRMKDTGFSKGWDPASRAEAVQRWKEEGRFALEGETMDTAVVARTMVDLLRVPPSAQVRLVDLREYDAGL
ncbi:MAG TPA: SDR family oxidoreductase [Ramlibacter sp.]|nr:SDR family oxidoreductase [Ramlibacter sp.]